MRQYRSPPLSAVVLVGAIAGAAAATTLEVDAATVLRRDADRCLGIDLNYIRDADDNRCLCAVSLDQALRDLGVRWLRYPGGEKSDFHLFAPPPYEQADPRSLADYAKYPGRRLDFDAYIACCRAVGAEPLVVVGCDNLQRTGRTWEQWLEHAVAWVRYANVVKGYGVKHWEIGNENWHNRTAPPEEMARIVVRFAQAMKAVDVSIRIGASGSGDGWWQAFLPIAAASIDILTVSVYNCWAWKGYDHYPEHPRVDLLGEAGVALRAIDRYAPAERQRLQVVVSETNSKDYSPGGWPGGNTLGHALVSFDTLGRMLAEPRIAAALLWTTRWMDDREAATSQWYALGPDNMPLPAGQAVALWGRHLHPNLVAVRGGSDLLGGWASASADGRHLSVWIVNRGRAEEAGVTVKVQGAVAFAYAMGTCYHGSGPDDPAPVLSTLPSRPLAGNIIPDLTCPGVSITALELSP